MTPPLECQPADDASIEIVHLGAEKSPLIRIDGATTHPDALVRYAAGSVAFTPVTDNLYPGLRAPMPLHFVRRMIARLDPLVRRVYALGDVRLSRAECFFSLVTTPAGRLKPYQTVPHIDTCDPLHFATVHYLCPVAFGGTAFFRQDATGFETVSPERESAWGAARDAMLGARGTLAYPSAATPGYSKIADVPAAFDRLILYRSNALHAGIVDPALDHSPDPRRGRLTATTFIGYRLNRP